MLTCLSSTLLADIRLKLGCIHFQLGWGAGQAGVAGKFKAQVCSICQGLFSIAKQDIAHRQDMPPKLFVQCYHCTLPGNCWCRACMCLPSSCHEVAAISHSTAWVARVWQTEAWNMCTFLESVPARKCCFANLGHKAGALERTVSSCRLTRTLSSAPRQTRTLPSRATSDRKPARNLQKRWGPTHLLMPFIWP